MDSSQPANGVLPKPDPDGLKLATKLTSLRPEMKVIFMSGYTESSIIDRDLLNPDVVFIQKPFEAQVLTRKVWELLNAVAAA